MADKKVDRSNSRRPLTPRQKMTASLSDPGTMDMADPSHDKGRSALADKFREREERWRREQAQRDRESSREREAPQQEGGPAAGDNLRSGGEGGAQ
jgi:hypothetical protein